MVHVINILQCTFQLEPRNIIYRSAVQLPYVKIMHKMCTYERRLDLSSKLDSYTKINFDHIPLLLKLTDRLGSVVKIKTARINLKYIRPKIAARKWIMCEVTIEI